MQILLIAPCSPFSPRSGAEQRTALLYEALAQLGRVDVLMILPADTKPLAAASGEANLIAQLSWQGSSFGVGKYAPDEQIARELVERGIDLQRYDLIVGRYLNPICKLRLPPGKPSIVDLDDWGKSYGNEAGSPLASLLTTAKGRYAHWLARRQLSRFDGYFFVSRRDAEREPERTAQLLPNIPFAPPATALPEANSKNLLFVGALWYEPNVLGIDRFISNCWPSIRQQVPEATLTLVGAASAEALGNWAKIPGVSAFGYVENLHDAYRNAAFCIAPIYSGGGSNIKILESLSFGRACVTSVFGAEVFANDLVRSGGLSAAANDDEFSAICVALLQDPEARARKSHAGRESVTLNYNRKVFFDAVRRLTQTIVDRMKSEAQHP